MLGRREEAWSGREETVVGLECMREISSFNEKESSVCSVSLWLRGPAWLAF